MRLHIRYSGSVRGFTQEVPNGMGPEEAIHHVLGKLWAEHSARSTLVFCEDDTGTVSFYGITFYDDPDNDPYYKIATVGIPKPDADGFDPVSVAQAKRWSDTKFQDSTVEIVGNFDI